MGDSVRKSSNGVRELKEKRSTKKDKWSAGIERVNPTRKKARGSNRINSRLRGRYGLVSFSKRAGVQSNDAFS